MDESYAEIGTHVILGKHKRLTNYGTDWIDERMDEYVGKEAVIRDVFQATDGCCVCYVDVDEGCYYWRVEDMILATDVPLLTPRQMAELGIES